MKDYYGLPLDAVENEFLRVEYLTSVGPRIVGLYFKGENLMAALPELKVDTPNVEYSFFGGHRLWLAPEDLATTYFPDNTPPEINKINSTCVKITGRERPPSGIEKSITISLNPNQASVEIDHIVTNNGEKEVRLAPWSLSQLVMGGLAILPQPTGPSDISGLLPNRNLILWPYSSWDDERVHFKDDYYLVDALPKKQAFKLGYMNTHGWIAYALKNILYCKRFNPQPGSSHPDMDCNAEVYVRDQFIELETLGPLVTLSPGKSTEHSEVWDLFGLKEPVVSIEQVRKIIPHTLSS